MDFNFNKAEVAIQCKNCGTFWLACPNCGQIRFKVHDDEFRRVSCVDCNWIYSERDSNCPKCGQERYYDSGRIVTVYGKREC